ncbi:MAG: hypothetical protein JWR16_2956 [Nevskia sp.]|nr:hypothetical protein [Nevskia sp.]
MKSAAKIIESREAVRLKVMRVHVQAVQVWFLCPGCNVALEGFLSDPRGINEITCQDCGTEFDIPNAADIVIC